MPLIDLKTDLKSLKYGNDRPGGGDSNQPYIKTDINKVDRGFNNFRLTRFDDGLIRGGIIGAVNASVTDTLRIAKFYTDLPRGPLWLAKQIGLQLTNPRLEYKTYNTNRQGGGFFANIANFVLNTANKILNAVGPTRIYNLGINTLAQVPVNAFGQHIIRHGFLPKRNEDSLYINVAQFNNNQANNRLTKLTSKFKLGDKIVTPSVRFNLRQASKANRILNRKGRKLTRALNKAYKVANPSSKNPFKFLKNKLDTTSLTIDSYIAGPSSIYGIGRTVIPRYDYTEDKLKIDLAFDFARDYAGQSRVDPSGPKPIDYTTALGANSKFQQFDNSIAAYDPTALAVSASSLAKTIILNSINYSSPSLKVYSEIANQIEDQKIKNTPVQFGVYGDQLASQNSTHNQNYIQNGILSNTEILPNVTSLPTYNNGKTTITIPIAWDKVTRELRVGSGKKDDINLTPIFSAGAGSRGDTVTIPGIGTRNINDLVKFRIQALDGTSPTRANWMIFRAYLTQLSDNTDATWNNVKYAGRGEDFYIYNGFSRKIQIGFKVAALSIDEMQPMYQKLNYLMGNLMPDYNGGLMRGPLVKMTVGNWIDGQDGILNSLSYTVPNDSPWEISINPNQANNKYPLILPHIIEVSMTFTPIGSQTKSTNIISQKSFSTSHIAQDYSGNKTYITGSIPRGT